MKVHAAWVHTHLSRTANTEFSGAELHRCP
jgi:hypothetical protein